MRQENNDDPENRETSTEYVGDKWGYVVCFGTIITIISCIGHINSIGLIFHDFIVETNSSSKSLTTAYGVFAMMLAVGGLLLNIISKHFSLRACGLIGSCLFISGSFITIPISHTGQLILTFGILQGIGFGIMVPVCYSMINEYFVKKRTTAMSVCKAIQGMIQIIYPQAIKELMADFGIRSTLLIISGISLHTVMGMMVMVPKLKKIQITAKHLKTGKRDAAADEKFQLISANTTERENQDKIKTRSFWTKCRSFSVVDWLSLSLLKDGVFCNICIGQNFVNFSDLSFFMLQPLLLFQNGFDQDEVALCISIGAGADVSGRCALAVLSSLFHVNTRVLYYVAAALTMLSRIVLLQVSGFACVAVMTGALGVLRALLHIASPLVVAGHVSKENFPAAYGLFLLTGGLVSIACNPLIGIIRDDYGDYTLAFYGLVACCLPCIVLWPVEYLALRRKTISTAK